MIKLSKKEKDLVVMAVQGVGVFLITFIILYFLGFVPKEIAQTRQYLSDNPLSEEEIVKIQRTFTTPDKITINKIGLESQIEKPQSQLIEILDQYLEQGPVYYPGSGTIEDGNIFVFGHSASAFNFVSRSAYKVFNDLEKLNEGDEIVLEADGERFVYSVESVSLVDENTAFVDFTKPGRRLTLSTCNTFGQPQDRWVVEAVFKEKRSI